LATVAPLAAYVIIGRSPVFSIICWLVALEELCGVTGVTELLEGVIIGETLLEEFLFVLILLDEAMTALLLPLLLLLAVAELL